MDYTDKRFEKLTKAEKRMVIAQDCIDRVNAGIIHPKTGRFFININTEYSESDCDTSLVNKSNFECQACIKGGLFVSYIARHQTDNVLIGNSLYPGDAGDHEHSAKAMKVLMELFTERQLAGIEAAFEEVIIVENEKFHRPYKNEASIQKFLDKCEKYFPENFEDYMGNYEWRLDNKLLSICKNIIKNKGTFDPDGIVEYDTDIEYKF